MNNLPTDIKNIIYKFHNNKEEINNEIKSYKQDYKDNVFFIYKKHNIEGGYYEYLNNKENSIEDSFVAKLIWDDVLKEKSNIDCEEYFGYNWI